ncbi:MAG: CDP-alcohol phosphatidyltransferase family protein [Planctomycetota bacterium]|nr:CDP-alcohol phosphatidyltransferase family protein [Planctomycetota bacterium]
MAAPLSTDEFVDRIFSRPVARLIVRCLAPTSVTANQVTGVAAVFGVGIGVALAFQHGWIAAGCILSYLAFDCADGQLARIRGGGGYLGRAMDGIGDYVTAISVHVGLALWISAQAGSWVTGWTLAALAGIAMAWSSFLLDRYKRRYRGDEDDLDALRAEAAATPGIKGWMISTLEPYAVRLEGGVRILEREVYQARVRWPLRLWLLGGPTTHFTAMAICYASDLPRVYAWIAGGPMLGLTLITLAWQIVAERRSPPVVASTR